MTYAGLRRAEQRDKKRRKKSRMGVGSRSVFTIQKEIEKRASRIKKKKQKQKEDYLNATR